MKSGNTTPIVCLPLEVLEVFIEFSPVVSQLAISRVSKLFHSLTLRTLYREISLSSPRMVAKCCRTLASNSGAAATVRSLSITYTFYSSAANSLLASYYSVIRKALMSLPDIHTLRLLVHDPYFITLLNRPIFPHLRQFECFLTPSPQLLNFLNLHPKLNYLQLSPHEDISDYSEESTVSLPTLELGSLQYFSGNAQCVAFLGAVSTLRAAFLSWNAIDTDPDMAFAVLQSSSCNSLSLLSCRRRGWNLDLIEAISERLPDVVSLHISNVLLVDSSPSDTYLQAIRAFLPRFTQLQRFWVNCIDYWEMGSVSGHIDHDFATVTEWGAACPSLSEIILPHSNGLTWYRVSGNVWIPDPKHTAGGKWLQSSLTKRHKTWSTIVEDIDDKFEKPSGPSDLSDSIAAVKRQLGMILKEKGAGLGPASLTTNHVDGGETSKASW